MVYIFILLSPLLVLFNYELLIYYHIYLYFFIFFILIFFIIKNKNILIFNYTFIFLFIFLLILLIYWSFFIKFYSLSVVNIYQCFKIILFFFINK